MNSEQKAGDSRQQSRTRDQGNTVQPHGKKPNKSKPKPLYFWDCADVNKWMKKWCGTLHEKYGELFLQQEITGRTLIRMNEIKLEKIGIVNPDHRRELMQQILRQRLKHEMSDLKNMDQEGTGFAQSRYQSIKEKDRDKHVENNHS
ncbi:protein aveugle-like [Saccostrea cucullata]|uniref:protein aveugle-like n=1 Tax=Saccostrea cuccullata TaxID=36930 RepID=UPI002ED1DD78